MAACASENLATQPILPPDDVAVCCRNFADFPWIKLDKDEKFDFLIDESSPVGKFAEGNSYFNAFQFSKQSKQVQLRLASKMLNGKVFAPKLITLDKYFQIVEFRDLAGFDLRAADAFSRNQYLLNMMLDAEKTPYFIIYTPANELGKTVQVDHPAKIRAKQFGEAMPMVTDPKYIFSPSGELSLQVTSFSFKGYQPVAENKQYYFDEIEKAAKSKDIQKALNLLQEAKEVGIEGVEAHFVQTVEGF